MQKIIVTSGILVLSLLLAVPSALAGDRDKFLNSDNCVNSKWSDNDGNSMSLDDKFGAGTTAVTRCLAKTKKVKVLYQINNLCKTSACAKAYAVGNIINHINDLEITHDISSEDYEIVVIVHSAGWKQVLNNSAAEKHAKENPFQSSMEDLVSRDGVKVLFCQNTASSKGIKLANMIPGIGFVTAGVSAISDLQSKGYRYVQP